MDMFTDYRAAGPGVRRRRRRPGGERMTSPARGARDTQGVPRSTVPTGRSPRRPRPGTGQGGEGAGRARPADRVARPPARLVPPGAGRVRPAHRDRPGHGRVGVAGRVAADRLDVGVHAVQEAVGVRHDRPARVLARPARPAAADQGAVRVAVVTACMALLVLVLTPLGHRASTTRGWFLLGPISFQPVEVAKLALTLWGAHVLVTKRAVLHQYRHLLVPVVPGRAADADAGRAATRPGQHRHARRGACSRCCGSSARRCGCSPSIARRRRRRRHRAVRRRAVPHGPGAVVPPPRSQDTAGPATRPTSRCTRWPTAACSAEGLGQGAAK